MREREVEQALVRAVQRVGGLAYKWVSPAHRGVPDRIVFLPQGRLMLVELKAPGKRPTQLQQRVHDRLRALGHDVRVIDHPDVVEAILDEICTPRLPAGGD